MLSAEIPPREVVDVDDEIIELEDEAALSLGSIEDLKARCTAAGLEISTRVYDEDEGLTYTSVGLPSGRNKRWVGATGERLQSLLNIEFEKFIFIQGHEAICSYTDGFIEAGIRGVSMANGITMRRLLIATGGLLEANEISVNPPEDQEARPKYKISPASPEFNALVQLPPIARRYTLKIEGLSVSNHDQASFLLSKYANSLLFQLDLLAGASFMLERERVRRFLPYRRNTETVSIQYPAIEYDQAPLSLYWYARSARGMPLLQFLAFYQCIEFYFPTFSQAEARRKIALLLKDPTFRSDRDSDVARLLSAISLSRSGGVGDERSQLRATINECLSAEEVRSFFDDDEELNEYFRGPQKKGSHKIPLNNENADLRNDVADRIYNIRCRIVHTKDGDHYGSNMILPFSDEADFLIYDIELAQFVARRVLIATSSLLS